MSVHKISEHESTLLMKAGTLIAEYVERYVRDLGEDAASDWRLSIIRRINNPDSASGAHKFLRDIEPELLRGACPRCLKAEGRKKARMIRGRLTVSLNEGQTALLMVPAKDGEVRLAGESAVEQFIAKLPPKEAEAIKLKAEGVSVRRIAEQFRMSERTLYSLFKKIRNRAFREGIMSSVGASAQAGRARRSATALVSVSSTRTRIETG
jgi:DNA-directed RNA polymerase specialized sigma24 family protein